MAAKKGWIIFFVIFGLFALMGVTFIFAIRAALDDQPIVKKDTVLKITLAGLISEHFPQDALSREFEDANLQMNDLLGGFAKAKVDDRIPGAFLVIHGLDIGWAKAQEIRQAIIDFKSSGKFVNVFMEGCDEQSYYVACAADAIYLQPNSFVEFNGFASEVPFLKRMFNKLGMEPQVDNIGEYKSAGDILKRETMSDAHREATNALLEDIYDEFVQVVCERRGLGRAAFEALLDRGVYDAEEALSEKLVDDLKYETEVVELMKEKVYTESTNSRDRSLTTMSIQRYAKVPPEEVGLAEGAKIALVYGIGSIVSGDGGVDPLFGRSMGSSQIAEMLQTVRKNTAIKAVVFRVDSPGGSALASDVIWAEIEKLQKEKPVVVSMSDVAASGGYWISMGSDAIVAQPTTITGSIGVVGAIFDMSETYDKLGINWATVKTNPYADFLTDKRPIKEAEWQEFKKQTADIYSTFVTKVAEGRGKTWDEVDGMARGRVWTGKRALELGLVDSLGGLDVALAIAKKKADLSADAATQWVIYPQPKGFVESVMEKFGTRLVRLMRPQLSDWALVESLPGEMKSALQQLAIFQRFRNGEVLAIEPQVPVVR
jgi:protease-4